jgi:hypothetical protein
MPNALDTDVDIEERKQKQQPRHMTGETATVAGGRLRLLARRVHALGPRPLYQMFRELAGGADFSNTAERYAALAPLADFIAANSGDQLPPVARLVGGRRQ